MRLSSTDPVRVHLEDGLRAQREGRLEPAREAYLRALALAPDHPEALNLLGTVWLQLGDASQAARYLERAAQKLRNHPGVVGNLAHAYCELGRFDEARESYRKASRLDPQNPYYPMGIANCLGMQGKLDEAEKSLRKLAERFSGSALVWYNLGNALREQRKLQDAIPCYLKALDLDPQLAEAQNNLGSVLHALYRFDEAERAYRACIASDPDYVAAQYNLASVLIDVGRFREGEEICRDIVRQDPTAAQGYRFLAAALGHQGRVREALECVRRALEIAPQEAKLVESYASTLAAVGDFSEALKWFARAFALSPDSVTAHQLLGHAMLAQGCLADGWVEYAYRPAYFRFRAKYPEVAWSRTLPPELAGKDIFVAREQGLGDELFFLRFAPSLCAAGARVTYRAGTKIRGLLARIGCLAHVVGETASAPQADAVMMVGDLPRALSAFAASPLRAATSDGAIVLGTDFAFRISVFWPPVPPALAIPPLESCLATMRRSLAEAGKPPYFGVSWKAGTPPQEQRGGPDWDLHKAMEIEPLAGALRDLPGTFIALQRNPEPGEVDLFSRLLGRQVHDFSALNEDLESMLSVLALIDEYIGVSNTNMHLRAAAGRTARVLVRCPAEWRWMASGSSSPWFPGFSLYRQSLDGDWSAALARLREDLSAAYR